MYSTTASMSTTPSQPTRVPAQRNVSSRSVIAALAGAVTAAVVSMGVPFANPATAEVDGTGSASGVAAKLVTVSEMPSGWVSEQLMKPYGACLYSLRIGDSPLPAAHVAYEEEGGGEVFAESLIEAASASAVRADVAKTDSFWTRCNDTIFSATNGSTGHIRISNVNVPTVGAHSRARALTASAGSSVANANIVTFAQGRYVGALVQTDSSGAPPDVATETELDQLALDRLQR
jgi:hypothetical protein